METLPNDFRRISVGALSALLNSEILTSPGYSKKAAVFPLNLGLKKLESSLKDTIRKVIDLLNHSEEHVNQVDSWIENSRLILEKQKLMYEKEVEASEEIKRQLLEQLEEISLQNEEVEKKREKLSKETSLFVEKLGELRDELEQKEKRKLALCEELMVLQKRNDELRTSLNQTITRKNEDMQRIKSIIDTYEKILGIRFVRTKGSIKCIYKYIDPDNHGKEFYFTLAQKNGAFQVVDCSHRIPSMDTLVSHLEINKDFFWFVKSVRKALAQLYGQEGRPAQKVI